MTSPHPRRTFLRTAAFAALWSVCPRAVAQGKEPSATEILDRVDDLFRGAQSTAKMEMTVTTENWTRTLSMEAWSKGKDKALVRILSPKKERGTATLRSGKEIWNYLPKVKRTIKLPSSMMSGSWMGSHFTNDDLVKESRFAEDYTFQVTFRGKRGAEQLVEIDCRPKPSAAVVWGKVLVEVEASSYLPVRVRYYSEDMKLARTVTFGKNQKFGSRTLPSIMTAVPADKPKESTRIVYQSIDFDTAVPDGMFSLRELQR